jgi:hypothetical protein
VGSNAGLGVLVISRLFPESMGRLNFALLGKWRSFKMGLAARYCERPLGGVIFTFSGLDTTKLFNFAHITLKSKLFAHYVRLRLEKHS